MQWNIKQKKIKTLGDEKDEMSAIHKATTTSLKEEIIKHQEMNKSLKEENNSYLRSNQSLQSRMESLQSQITGYQKVVSSSSLLYILQRMKTIYRAIKS